MYLPSHKPCIANLTWDMNSGLHLDQHAVVEEMGYSSILFQHSEPIPEGADIVIIQGPYGSVHPFVEHYYQLAPERRPKVIYWFQQSLYGALPVYFFDALSYFFSDFNRTYESGSLASFARLTKRFLKERGCRFKYWGDIKWLHQNQIIDLLAVSGSNYQSALHRYHIPSILVHRGYYPSQGRLLNNERDISVTWMGKFRTARRKNLIYRLRDQLEKTNLRMEIIDGECKPFVFGDQRTQVLNRSKFMLSLRSIPFDELSIRFYIGGANGSVVLTEKNDHEYPFEHGVHWIESRPDQMAEQVLYYEQHEDERLDIALNMYQLITRKLTLKRTIYQLINEVLCIDGI